MIDVLAKKTCPICDGEMIRHQNHNDHIRQCQNGCYGVMELNEGKHLFFFFKGDFGKEVFSEKINNSLIENMAIRKSVANEIKYWREKDRYLIRIMGCD